MRRPHRAPLFAIAGMAAALVVAVAAVAVIRSPTPGAPSPTADAGWPAVGVVPAADPMPWTSVTWRRLVLAPGMPPGHARIDGLVRAAPGLVAWGRTAMPGRNQFDDMGAAYRSAAGDRWTVVPIDAGVGPRDTSEIRVVAWGPAGLLALGGVCCDDEERPAAWTSPDGTAWTRVPVDPDLAVVEVSHLIATDDGFLAAGAAGGRAAILVSSDGVAWDAVDPAVAGLGPGGVSPVAATRAGYHHFGWAAARAPRAGAAGRFADGRSWAKVEEPLLAGDQDTQLWQSVPFAGGEHLTGNEGPHAERIRCEQLLGLQASVAGPAADPAGTVDLSCGWGLETEWLRVADGALQRLPVRWLGGVAPPPGTFAGSALIVAGGPGLLAIGEAEGEAGVRLWTSRDGRSWERALPDQPFAAGASVSGLVVDGRRLIAVGEDWDPNGNQPGVPAIWLGVVD